MQFHTIKRKTKNRKKMLVGRGGKRGKTAGRGTKGQKARAGRKLRPELRDIIKKLPKLRGYAFNSIVKKNLSISLERLDGAFESGAVITKQALAEKGVVSLSRGKVPSVKIVGGKKDFALGKKFSLEGIPATAGAKEAIEKAGGSVK